MTGTAAVAGLTFDASPARSVEFKAGSVGIQFDTKVSAAIGIGVEDANQQTIGSGNGGAGSSVNYDDGKLNYQSGGDIYSTITRVNHELEMTYGDWSVFGRGYYFYDFDVMHGDTDRTELSDSAKNRVGKDYSILDAYVNGDLDVGGVPVSVRIGNQVISWGESTFIPNGINTINPFNVANFRTAGAEVRDALLPIPAIRVNASLNERFSVDAYYQMTWHETEIDPSGTYFSTSDFAGPGGAQVHLDSGTSDLLNGGTGCLIGGALNCALIGGDAVGRADDRDGSDWNQFGVALRYFEPELNDTEFGLYYLRYNSRLPVISATAGSVNTAATLLGQQRFAPTSNYFVEYPDDIELYGFSFNTSFPGGMALQGEFAYRKDQPLQIDDQQILGTALTALNNAVGAAGTFPTTQIGTASPNEEIQGFRRKDVFTAQTTATDIYSNVLGLDELAVVGEVGLAWVPDLEEVGTLSYEAPGAFDSVNTAGAAGGNEIFADKFSWGYRALVRGTINNAIGPVTLIPSVAFAHDVSGTTPQPLTTFVQNRKRVSLGVTADYLNAARANLSYTKSFGGGRANLGADRDFVTISMSYSF